MMMFDDREKRNVIALSVLILFMLILFGPLFTVHSKYSGNEENNLNEVNSGQLQSKEDVNDNICGVILSLLVRNSKYGNHILY